MVVLDELHILSLAKIKPENHGSALSYEKSNLEKQTLYQYLNQKYGKTGRVLAPVVTLAGPRAWEDHAEVLVRQGDFWHTGRWVGWMQLGPVEVEICPRVGWDVFWALLEQGLGLTYIGRVPGGEGQKARGARQILAVLWVRALDEARRFHGTAAKGYVMRHEPEASTLRGRLDVGGQIRNQLHGRAHRAACRYPLLTHDVVVNRGILYVVDRLRRERLFPFGPLSAREQRQEVVGFARRLRELGVRRPLSFPQEPVRWTRANGAYRRVHELGRILAGQHTLGLGEGKGESLLFDSAEVWELFVYRMLREAVRKKPSWRVTSPRLDHRAREYLYAHLSPPPSWKLGGMVPDFLLENDRGERVVVDAKYRFLTRQTLEDVLPQMVRYASHYPNVKKVVLLFPRARKMNMDGANRWEGILQLAARRIPMISLALPLQQGKQKNDKKAIVETKAIVGMLESLLNTSAKNRPHTEVTA